MSYLRFIKSSEYNDTGDFPIKIQYSFRKLIEWWQQQLNDPDGYEADRAAEVFKRLDKNPILKETFTDVSILDTYQEDIQLLLSPFFPSLTTTNDTRAACMPYQNYFFNTTKRFAKILDDADGNIAVPKNKMESMYVFGSIPMLNTLYNARISFNRNFYFDIPDKKTGIIKRYRAFFNADFAEIKPLTDIDLTQQDIRELINNFDNVPLWKEKIPPNSFVYEGITIVTLFDVTKEESVSALKYDLLKKDALVMPDIVERIRTNLSALMNIANLKTGFISWNSERNLLQAIGYGIWNSIVLRDKKTKTIKEAFCHNSEECVFNKRAPYILPEIVDDDSVLTRQLLRQNLKSYIAIPLLYNNELVGVLELGSESTDEINAITPHKLEEVIPLFTSALQRSQEEFQNQLESIIRQECTAIHPTVSWRFTEAAEKLVNRRRFFADSDLEDIIFENVYPLYGQVDIQGSSTQRNRAIQHDLTEQLQLAKKVLDDTVSDFPLPIYKELQFRIENYIEKLGNGLVAGDENQVLEFLRSEIYPVFNHIETLSPRLNESLQVYHKLLDPAFGTVYKLRKDYEQTVKLINDKVSDYLEKTQVAAQKMFPHYFEKFQTDGVDHNLYIGQSLVNNRTFHPLYLQNIRLWQLLMMCETETMVHKLKPNMKTKLEICSLVLVHSNPMTIHFRKDEKQFGVEGAYNIRYEIIKKRIDKAIVKETNERLTIPGKIAIVYTHDKDAKEYINYLNYLQNINYVGSEIEWLTLKDMQGVTGLKALRADIIYQNSFNGNIKESKAVELLQRMN